MSAKCKAGDDKGKIYVGLGPLAFTCSCHCDCMPYWWFLYFSFPYPQVTSSRTYSHTHQQTRSSRTSPSPHGPHSIPLGTYFIEHYHLFLFFFPEFRGNHRTPMRTSNFLFVDVLAWASSTCFCGDRKKSCAWLGSLARVHFSPSLRKFDSFNCRGRGRGSTSTLSFWVQFASWGASVLTQDAFFTRLESTRI